MKPCLRRGLLVGALALICVFLMSGTRRRGPSTPAPPTNPVSARPATPAPAPEHVKPSPLARSKVAPAHPSSTPPPAQDSASAFRSFNGWATQFLSGVPGVSEARGAALAWKRREAMLDLIQTDPAQALALAVPFHWRTALPPSVTRYFEQQVDGRGALDVAIAESVTGKTTVLREARLGGRRYHAFVYGRRIGQPCQTQIPLHGIALDGKLAVSAAPVRLLDLDEAEALAVREGQHPREPKRVETEPGSRGRSPSLRGSRPAPQLCVVCGQAADPGHGGVAADIGGELACFCGVDHAEVVNQHWISLEQAGASAQSKALSIGRDSWTHGPKTVLYMRVNFPDDLTEPISEANAYGVMNEVNAFYAEDSYDVTSLTATVTPLVTVPQTKAWYGTNDFGEGALLADAREAARLAGYDTANYDLDIASFTTVPTYSFGGLAYVGAKGLWLQSPGAGVTAHELGHNYGLMHANFWDTSANNSSSSIGAGTNRGVRKHLRHDGRGLSGQ